MPARLTAYLPDRPAASCLLRTEQRVRIGRGGACEFLLEHASVSREHAELSWQEEQWRLQDLNSKNGSFVDSVRIAAVQLNERAWLRFGDVLCEFTRLSEQAADAAQRRLAVRRANSLILLDGPGQQTALPDLLQETVRAAVELADCERGFLLLSNDGAFDVVASHGLQPDALRGRQFRGSIGAVQRALDSRAAVVVNDVAADMELAARASVIDGGMCALVCLPLLSHGEVMGLLYADSRVSGTVITTMDLDLLRAFAERAALWIAARRGIAALAELELPVRLEWAQILDAQQSQSA
ncbi:MAG: FHA domain-containing protein [Arenimonas sp.]